MGWFLPTAGSGGVTQRQVVHPNSPFTDGPENGAGDLNTFFNASQTNRDTLRNVIDSTNDANNVVTIVMAGGQSYRWGGEDQPTTYSADSWIDIQMDELVSGDREALDSVKGLTSGTVPVATSQGLGDSLVTQPDDSGIMVDGEVSSTKDTINIGQGLSLSEDGLDIKATNPVENLEAIPLRTLLNSDGTTGQNLAVNRSDRQMVVLQPAFSETNTGTWSAHVPVTETRIVKAIGSRFASVATGVRVTARNASSTSDTTGVILYQSHTDQEWNNGGGIDIVAAPAVTTVNIDNSAKFIQGNLVYVVIEQHPTGTGTLEIQGITTTIGPIGPQFFAYLEQTYVIETLNQVAMQNELSAVATSGSYNDLSNAPTIPTDTNDFVDSASFSLSGQDLTLTLGRTGSLTGLTASVTLPSGSGGGTNPPADADRIYYGLASSSDTTAIDVTTLTRENDPTNPDTISSGAAVSGQYFVLFVPMTHDIVSITDTVLQEPVTDFFTSLDNAQVVDTIAFKSYIIGPLNAGFNETYEVAFS